MFHKFKVSSTRYRSLLTRVSPPNVTRSFILGHNTYTYTSISIPTRIIIHADHELVFEEKTYLLVRR